MRSALQLLPAIATPPDRDRVRLMVVGPGRLDVRDFAGFPDVLHEGDVVVVNDAATWPASLRGDGVELRLTTGALSGNRTWAVLFGAGDWRTRTEDRPPPPVVRVGDLVAGLRITEVSAMSPRLVQVELPDSDAGMRELFARGRPVQYAHLEHELAPWDVQTVYAGRPWAVEMPSAGRPFTWGLLAQLAGRGVRVATLTHAAGLSSTGDPKLDATLPWPERYEIPVETTDAIASARERGGRVIAVGTTVVRALETWARSGVRAGFSDLVIGARHRLRTVDAVLSGLHDPSDSHFRLLEAFAPRAALVTAWQRARELEMHGHELGDVMLVLRYPR
jgi:S-adenosylmethionine:tRNA ribosyltransferase-isomerase